MTDLPAQGGKGLMIIRITVTASGQQGQQQILLQSEEVLLIPVIGSGQQQELMRCHFYLFAARHAQMQQRCTMNTNYLLESMKVIALLPLSISCGA